MRLLPPIHTENVLPKIVDTNILFLTLAPDKVNWGQLAKLNAYPVEQQQQNFGCLSQSEAREGNLHCDLRWMPFKLSEKLNEKVIWKLEKG